MFLIRLAVISALSLCLALPAAYGQLTGQVNGTITDGTGAIITGANITVVNQDTGVQWTATTNPVGYYIVPMLQPGVYRVEVSNAGFRTVRRAGISLAVAQSVLLDFVLELGQLTEAVEVKDESPLLDTSTNAIGQVVDSRETQQSPHKRPQFQFLPGADTRGAGARGMRDTVQDQYLSVFVSINGARPNQNQFYIDGGNNTQSSFNGPVVTPSPDIVQEFRVQTNNFSAEHTNAAGGVVNLVTKAGTNQFHGTLFEYLRNDKLTANGFFLNREGRPRPSFRYNQFGGTVGGPIKRDKTFIFYGYEGLRWNQPSVARVTIPTALQRQGDFSQTMNAQGQRIVVYDPSTTRADTANPGRYVRTPFPGNVLSQNRISPVAAKAIGFYPQPNAPGDPSTDFFNFVYAGSSSIPKNDHSGRLDHNLGNKVKLFARMTHNDTATLFPDLYGEGNPGVARGRLLRPETVLHRLERDHQCQCGLLARPVCRAVFGDEPLYDGAHGQRRRLRSHAVGHALLRARELHAAGFSDTEHRGDERPGRLHLSQTRIRPVRGAGQLHLGARAQHLQVRRHVRDSAAEPDADEQRHGHLPVQRGFHPRAGPDARHQHRRPGIRLFPARDPRQRFAQHRHGGTKRLQPLRRRLLPGRFPHDVETDAEPGDAMGLRNAARGEAQLPGELRLHHARRPRGSSRSRRPALHRRGRNAARQQQSGLEQLRPALRLRLQLDRQHGIAGRLRNLLRADERRRFQQQRGPRAGVQLRYAGGGQPGTAASRPT